MINSADLYLGAFLILCGFALSILNLRRLIKENNSSFPAVLISENILLMCIGMAFISRFVHHINPFNTEMHNIQERTADMVIKEETMDCNFLSVLKSYGPLVISLVNSFLSLLIDNYMHYRMLDDATQEDEENTVQELSAVQSSNRSQASKSLSFFKKYFLYIVIALQWTVPVLIALSMYPMELKERRVLLHDIQSTSDFCMAMVDATNETCLTSNFDGNDSLELRKIIPPIYLEAQESILHNDSVAKEINSVIKNVFQVIANLKKETLESVNVTIDPLSRKPKSGQNCMKVCYLDNESLVLYMFIVAVISYFVPITISTVILTKIHVMNVKKPSMTTFVSRELLYNILFWTPVMFDTFLSLVLCSYSMNGMRTSIFNVIANVYQAVKNFMNTKYFKENTVSPI